jgi:hypothetical protein
MKNFGKIKNAFNEILAEGVVSKNDSNKQLFKKYIKTIKENEVLKTQFLVYDNIENKIEENEFKANLFLQENIALFNKYSKEEILEANNKLAESILSEQKNASYDNEKLHEDISNLIFLKKEAKNIDAIVEATANVINYMKKNKAKVVTESIDLPNSMLTTIMVEKYNEKYSALTDETDKQILKALIESNDEKKKEVYSIVIRECIDLIDEKLKESDLDAKDKLLRVKDKLLNDKQEISEDFNKNISKLVELKKSLK